MTRRGLLWALAGQSQQPVFPPPESKGGWRKLDSAAEIRREAGMDSSALDGAFEVCRNSGANGGLVVVRRGWLVFERYFGRGHREATPNLASCGKSFTSIAMGILLGEKRAAFPQGLATRVFAPEYLPTSLFPFKDPRFREIRLGQLLAMTAGIRGNSPGRVRGREVTLDPPGADGWPAMRDAEEGRFDLWCAPGEGYSYATASVQLVSMILRRVSGMELADYVRQRIAEPLGWSAWGYGYRQANLRHTAGGGGIAMRARDVVRFLYLLLNRGRWRDRQIVPETYLREATRRSRYNPHTAYSLQFDINADGHLAGVPRDAYWKSGSGGHAMYVVPSLDLVAFKLGGRDSQYASNDTGLPETPATDKHKPPPEPLPPQQALQELLNRIVACVN